MAQSISLILSLATIAASLVSLWRFDRLTVGYAGQRIDIQSDGGGISMGWIRRYELRPQRPTFSDNPAAYREIFEEQSIGRLLRPGDLWGQSNVVAHQIRRKPFG
jgi:hypothetical protein